MESLDSWNTIMYSIIYILCPFNWESLECSSELIIQNRWIICLCFNIHKVAYMHRGSFIDHNVWFSSRIHSWVECITSADYFQMPTMYFNIAVGNITRSRQHTMLLHERTINSFCVVLSRITQDSIHSHSVTGKGWKEPYLSFEHGAPEKLFFKLANQMYWRLLQCWMKMLWFFVSIEKFAGNNHSTCSDRKHFAKTKTKHTKKNNFCCFRKTIENHARFTFKQ